MHIPEEGLVGKVFDYTVVIPALTVIMTACSPLLFVVEAEFRQQCLDLAERELRARAPHPLRAIGTAYYVVRWIVSPEDEEGK